ncbi:MAG: hypothetical protein LBP73_11810, partial [Clostridiales Family XIII bacterium]|nr:hypothetical protein [Clostridiales Family XIII bacterium]
MVFAIPPEGSAEEDAPAPTLEQQLQDLKERYKGLEEKGYNFGKDANDNVITRDGFFKAADSKMSERDAAMNDNTSNNDVFSVAEAQKALDDTMATYSSDKLAKIDRDFLLYLNENTITYTFEYAVTVAWAWPPIKVVPRDKTVSYRQYINNKHDIDISANVYGTPFDFEPFYLLPEYTDPFEDSDNDGIDDSDNAYALAEYVNANKPSVTGITGNSTVDDAIRPIISDLAETLVAINGPWTTIRAQAKPVTDAHGAIETAQENLKDANERAAAIETDIKVLLYGEGGTAENPQSGSLAKKIKTAENKHNNQIELVVKGKLQDNSFVSSDLDILAGETKIIDLSLIQDDGSNVPEDVDFIEWTPSAGNSTSVSVSKSGNVLTVTAGNTVGTAYITVGAKISDEDSDYTVKSVTPLTFTVSVVDEPRLTVASVNSVAPVYDNTDALIVAITEADYNDQTITISSEGGKDVGNYSTSYASDSARDSRITFSGSTITIGKDTNAGEYSVAVTATDAMGQTANLSFVIKVSNAYDAKYEDWIDELTEIRDVEAPAKLEAIEDKAGTAYAAWNTALTAVKNGITDLESHWRNGSPVTYLDTAIDKKTALTVPVVGLVYNDYNVAIIAWNSVKITSALDLSGYDYGNLEKKLNNAKTSKEATDVYNTATANATAIGNAITGVQTILVGLTALFGENAIPDAVKSALSQANALKGQFETLAWNADGKASELLKTEVSSAKVKAFMDEVARLRIAVNTASTAASTQNARIVTLIGVDTTTAEDAKTKAIDAKISLEAATPPIKTLRDALAELAKLVPVDAEMTEGQISASDYTKANEDFNSIDTAYNTASGKLQDVIDLADKIIRANAAAGTTLADVIAAFNAAEAGITDILTGDMFDKYGDIKFDNADEGVKALLGEDYLEGDLKKIKEIAILSNTVNAFVANAGEDVASLIGIKEFNLETALIEALKGVLPDFEAIITDALGDYLDDAQIEAILTALEDLTDDVDLDIGDLFSSDDLIADIDKAIGVIKTIREDFKFGEEDGVQLQQAIEFTKSVVDGSIVKKYEALDIDSLKDVGTLLKNIKADV